MARLKNYIKSLLERKYKLKMGDLVKDKGDGFARVEDPGIVIELFPNRYEYAHPLFLGFLKIHIDGILVRWLDKKGTSHVYPACCVEILTVEDEVAERLRTTAKGFDEPALPPEKSDEEFEKQMEIFDSIEEATTGASIEEADTLDAPAPEVQEDAPQKPSLNKMQEQLREVERIIEERTRTKEEGEE